MTNIKFYENSATTIRSDTCNEFETKHNDKLYRLQKILGEEHYHLFATYEKE